VKDSPCLFEVHALTKGDDSLTHIHNKGLTSGSPATVNYPQYIVELWSCTQYPQSTGELWICTQISTIYCGIVEIRVWLYFSTTSYGIVDFQPYIHQTSGNCGLSCHDPQLRELLWTFMIFDFHNIWRYCGLLCHDPELRELLWTFMIFDIHNVCQNYGKTSLIPVHKLTKNCGLSLFSTISSRIVDVRVFPHTQCVLELWKPLVHRIYKYCGLSCLRPQNVRKVWTFVPRSTIYRIIVDFPDFLISTTFAGIVDFPPLLSPIQVQP
jgi:hypothetical protein